MDPRIPVRAHLLLWLAVPALAAALPPPPAAVRALDTPNDSGGSVTVAWARADSLPEDAVYTVYVAADAQGPFFPGPQVRPDGDLLSAKAGDFGHDPELARTLFAEVKDYARGDSTIALETGRTYAFRVGLRTGEGESRTDVVRAAAAGNWFNTSKVNNFVIGTFLSVVILVSIAMARRRELYIRRIAGLEALDEALGRATEMGKPVLFIHGLREMDKISTIAAVNILGRVARRTAEYDAALKVTNYDPVVMSVSQETVKAAYIEAGRPDAYREDNIFVAGTDQFSYAAAVEGIMVRERPAAHIMMGYFYAESLLLAETGSTTGAIQIAGTDAYTQLPFFVTTCDYTLLGEELYAASAYLSREPRLLGSLKGQDFGKAVILGILVLGTLLASAGIPHLTWAFSAY